MQKSASVLFGAFRKRWGVQLVMSAACCDKGQRLQWSASSGSGVTLHALLFLNMQRIPGIPEERCMGSVADPADAADSSLQTTASV